MRIGSSTLELRVESTSGARDARCGLRCVSHRRVGPLSSLTDRVAAVSHRHWTESRCVHRLDRAALVGSSRAPPLLAGRLAWSCGRTGRRLSTPDKGRLDWSRPLVAHWAMPSRPTDTLSVSLSFEASAPALARLRRHRALVREPAVAHHRDEAWATPARPSTTVPTYRRIATSPAGSAWIASRPRMTAVRRGARLG